MQSRGRLSDSLLRIVEHTFADLMHAPERCDAYQVFVSGVPSRDYQGSSSPLSIICYCHLLFHVGSSDTARSSLDCKVLARGVRGSGEQATFHQTSCLKGRGLKAPVECEKSTSGYRAGATAKGLTASDHELVTEKPGQMGTGGVCLSEKGKNIFSHRLSTRELRSIPLPRVWCQCPQEMP